MKAQHQSKQKKAVEVFDPQFKYVKEIPASLVRHMPPARLNITRLVFCRNYVPGQAESCNMGDGCKFVHADVDPESLESHPIHVKYSWRHEDVCTYARLPAGEVLHVTAPNNRPPVEEIASSRVLVTRGSLRYRNPEAVHHHCMHYHQHRMCNRGERCNFIHVVHVDPNVSGDFKRAPFSHSQTSGRQRHSPLSLSDALSDQDADAFPDASAHSKERALSVAGLDLPRTTANPPLSAVTAANQSQTRGRANSNISFSNVDVKRMMNSGSFVLTPGSVNNEAPQAAPCGWPSSPTTAHIALDTAAMMGASNGTMSPPPHLDDNVKHVSLSTYGEVGSIRATTPGLGQVWFHHNPYQPRSTSKIVYEK
ncbi:zinc finger protein, putative [Bodo saltans]|uniref:Zinc finger protein, putative n=1 Tax=Bodo saltans TaxID=75058 RepID=A0A0S4JN73_BODSA|nr:zinc finger protein, putative [Bodo saltans]|eukprot:CUG91864.1 zinc finger protein, putative [Bodo saltans]